MKQDKRLSVVVPFYNEVDQVPITCEVLSKILDGLEMDYELILIDDGSKDGTWQALSNCARTKPRIRLLRFSRNFGKEAAITAGMDAVTGHAVILLDGDLQHPPDLIPEMVRLWLEEGYDIVDGVKADRGTESALSRFAANTFYGIFEQSGGMNLKDASDFKLLNRRALEAYKLMREQGTFFRGMSAWLGFRRINLPFEVQDRETGTSKWRFTNLVRLSLNAVTSFSAKPLEWVALLGIIFLFLATLLGLQTLIRWIIGHAVAGFTTVILLQLLIGGLVITSLGLIGLYIARIYDEVKGRPRYLLQAEVRPRSEDDDPGLRDLKDELEFGYTP